MSNLVSDPHDRREESVSFALIRLVDQIERMSLDTQDRVLEAVAEALVVEQGENPDGCLLCNWTDGCKPGCAREAISRLVTD